MPLPDQARWLSHLKAQQETTRGRLRLSAAALLITLIFYHTLNNIEAAPSTWPYIKAIDAELPFLPWTLPIYMSLYVQMLVAAWLVKGPRYTKVLLALILCAAAASLCFWLIPAQYPRPAADTISAPLWRAAFEAMHQGDKAGNTFPSLHVAAATLLGLALHPHRWRALWWSWSVAIALSTLSVKQHFALDLLGGVALATLTYVAVNRTSRANKAHQDLKNK